jgi:hypothetical protein|tara:strand:+ start:44231 stop:44479 length:249 start_codon:yes stop_codon:yes gene_type:complete
MKRQSRNPVIGINGLRRHTGETNISLYRPGSGDSRIVGRLDFAAGLPILDCEGDINVVENGHRIAYEDSWGRLRIYDVAGLN